MVKGGIEMPKRTKAVYDVVTTYGMHRELIFTLHTENGRSYINVVNTRSGEFHQEPYKKDFYQDFIVKCEGFIRVHFGKHLNYFRQVSYQEGN